MTSEKNKSIVLMVPEFTSASILQQDRGGGETHGMKEVLQKIVGQKNVDPETIKRNIEECMSQISEVLSKVSQNVTENWKLGSVSVGLSINAEGSIGIATAGVETSIEISFVPKSSK